MATSKTLFVRNLPYLISDSQLEEVFTCYGPLKKCFTVKDQGVTNQCRGFGYVTYALREDALRAKSCVKVIQKRPVQILFANKKSSVKTSSKDDSSVAQDSDQTHRSAPQYDIGRIVVVTGFNDKVTRKHIENKFKKIGNVDEIEYPVPGRDSLTAFVTYKTHKEARLALKLLNNQVLKGSTLNLTLLSREVKGIKTASLKKSRIIVRNISFQSTEEDIIDLFSTYGTVLSVQIPRKPNNYSLGYAFVQFSSYFEALEAVKSVNGTMFKGRHIAVDWVVPRELYKSKISHFNELDERKTEVMEDYEKKDMENEAEEEDMENEIDDENMENDAEEEDMENEIDDENMENEAEEQLEEDMENEKEDSEASLKDEEELDEDKPAPVCDVQEGKTVFVRNVSFDVDQQELSQLFERYGRVHYCKPVMEQTTNTCKGSAFVKYRTKDSTQLCLESATTDEGIRYRDEKLHVVLALSREDLAQRKKQFKEQQYTKKDKRNLYLLEEGFIDPLSEVAQELSKSDLTKRTKSMQERKRKLKNPYFFVSRTRLSVRNLPPSLDEKSLKSLFLKHGGEKSLIKQVKLIRSKSQYMQNGLGRSVGYGFVELKDHQSALTALRNINNNPTIFGPDKRPIVEFALEDSRALKLMQQRRERQQQSKPRSDRNKKVKWQLKWKARRLKQKEQGKMKQRNSDMDRKKTNRHKAHDKRRITVKETPVLRQPNGFYDMVTNYKKKLFSNN